MPRFFMIAATLIAGWGAGAVSAQTSQRPGQPIRVILDEPKNAPRAAPPAQAVAPPKAVAAPRPASPAKIAAPAKAAPVPAVPARAVPPTAAAKPAPTVVKAPAVARPTPPRPARVVAVAKPKPAPVERARPRKLPPFPAGPFPGKPETYRREIEAWRDKLEQQRAAWGGDTYPAYRRALATYQAGIDKYLVMIGRPRAPKTETKAD